MKISAIGSVILLLACVTCNYGQVDMAKGLALMQKAMSCFGNVDMTKMMQMGGNNGDIGKLMQAFKNCKQKPMDQIVECVGRETGVNSTVLNCLTGVMKSATTQ